jgi:hypothetical protein
LYARPGRSWGVNRNDRNCLHGIGACRGAPSERRADAKVRHPHTAWCLVQAGIHFDVTTVDNERRVWTLRSRSIGAASVRIVEDRGCSSYPSDIQSKSEGPGRSALDGSAKYVIRWKLHKDDSCNLSVEVPMVDGARNALAYELAVSGLNACTDDRCTGPSLKSSP